MFPENSDLDEVVDLLAHSTNACALTGAGCSAESGIPTFRDAQVGLWSRYNPAQLASPEAFASSPDLVWMFYRYRRDVASKCFPNPGHVALARLEAVLPNFHIITQNVDTLHEQAGSTKVIRLHGKLFEDLCSVHCRGVPTRLDRTVEKAGLPHCPHCDALARPGVVWFGESLPEEELLRAHSVVSKCDLVFVIGTSNQVYPAAALVEVAHTAGARIVEINPNETPLSGLIELSFREQSGVLLPAMVERLEERTTSREP